MEAINNLLARIPIFLIVILYLVWAAYSFWNWYRSPNSEFGVKKAAVFSAQNELVLAKKKLAQGQEFFKHLDEARTRIRQLTVQLNNTKATLSTEVDLANFVRMITLEAKKLGLIIKGIKPEAELKKEYYFEVPFMVLVRGAYAQIVVFFDRISKLQQVVRISDFELKPTGATSAKFVELDGAAKLITYKYLGTQADEVLHKEEMKTENPQTAVEQQGGGQ